MLTTKNHNARNVFGTKYYIDTSDPKLNFYITEEFSDIRVRIAYLFTGQFDWLESVFDEETKVFQRLEKEVTSARRESAASSERLKIAAKKQEEIIADLENQYQAACVQIKNITQELESLKMENTMYQKKIAEQLLLQQSLKSDYERLQQEYQSLAQKTGNEYGV